ncbi:c6 transcription [Moniliophthora roreri MCA 2997]|uniref:C6 transcription n=2 Tax=Moniliophthora roreri TaxID=221103 RepID=V2WVE7_MONRO|nr:c6 transcription [Moniliophthora roreri MCA 2997]KAI3608997.1 c6 transcription [Moniliophthora roreri]
MSITSSATAFKLEGVIRFHTKSRSGCLTCRKRRIKCDETKPVCKKCYRRNLECVQRPKNEHNQERQQQEIVVRKPLTAPTPIPMSITSFQILHHFATATSASFHSEPGCINIMCTVPPHLSWDNPHLFHALLSFSALHLGRLYPEEPKWVYLASAHRKAAIDALPGATNPDAKFVMIGVFVLYTISSSLFASPKNIFSLMTSLHNVLFPFVGRRSMYEDQRMRAVDPFSVNLQANLVEALGHLQQIYDFCMPGFESESGELFDPSIRAAYQKAVEALYVAYPLSQTGYETKCAVLWPALFGKKFRDLLNERRQRALVVLYYYLGMMKDIGERCWWASEAGRCQNYIYGLLDVGWRGWVLQYDDVTKNSVTNSTRLTY